MQNETWQALRNRMDFLTISNRSGLEEEIGRIKNGGDVISVRSSLATTSWKEEESRPGKGKAENCQRPQPLSLFA